MKSLNQKEINIFVSRLRSLQGSTLKSVISSPPLIFFEFYKNKKDQFLILDLTPSRPVAFLHLDPLPIKLKKQPKPISLFIKAHFVGKSVTEITFAENRGRTFEIHFGQDHFLEMRLFPHGQNLIANSEKKQVAWNKPKPLTENIIETSVLEARPESQIFDEWLKSRSPKKQNAKNPEEQLAKLQQKLDRAISKIKETLIEKEQELQDIENLISEKSQIPENQEDLPLLYEERKALNKKISGQKNRLDELIKEKSQLSIENIKIDKSHENKKKIAQDIKAKRWTLDSGITVAVGKNAKENTELLRKAKPWDLWLHLRDYPGAYGFIYRQKNQKILDSDLKELALWVAKMSLKNRWEKVLGDKLTIVYAESRFVQPIKGDKLGRVTYKNAKTFVVLAEQDAAQKRSLT